MTDLDIPNALPVLSSGHHPGGSGRACAMDAVSFIQGKPEQGDAPECVHRVLREAFIRTNDSLPDNRRHELWPLILRAMGTADRAPTDEFGAKRLNVGLAVWCARHVQHLVRVKDAKVCEDAIAAAERWVADPSEANAADAANAAAYATYAANAADAAAYAAYAAAYAAANAADAADAATYATYAANAADAANAATYAADAADAADARLASLAALIDEYDRLTGSKPDPIDIPWDEMVEALGVSA